MIQKITLLELNKSIQDTLKNSFPGSIWIIAEISELKVNRNGHCYIELIEKDAITDNIIAKTRAIIWAFTFRMLKPYFENTTGHELIPGLKILIQAKIEFHELYGLSLNITDIDPNYTLGDLAQKRIEILKNLEEDGVFNMNKEVFFPIVPQKIAVISSETAAGYQDFINQLTNNTYGFKYYVKLFPAIMQGVQAEESIITSLEKIYDYEDLFDIVVVIRGGGSQADLNCFDNYLLASNIAQFPLPVLTGIGHDKDESVVDIVAHQKLKTPTAVAEFIIERTNEFNNYLDFQKNNISNYILDYIDDQKNNISNYINKIIPVARIIVDKNSFLLKITVEQLKNISQKNIHVKTRQIATYSSILGLFSKKNITKKNNNLHLLKNMLENNYKLNIQKQNLILENNSDKIELLNPENILKRGYSITYKNGKRIKNVNELEKKDEIITKLFSGYIRSIVEEKSEIKNKT